MMNRKFFSLFLIVGLIIIPLITFASQSDPETGSIKGFIYNKDGQTPKSQASIELQRIERSNDNEKINYKEKYTSEKTDTSGKYLLKGLPVGEYMVRIRVNDKKVRVKKIDFFIKIFKDRMVEFSFTLQK
jgi:hypothetical protein